MINNTNEDDILERLNEQPDIHGLLKSAIDIISDTVTLLILKVFRKDDYSSKFVIPYLVGHNGPLNNLSLRLKLLFALGLITREEYEDIELLMAILDELDADEREYSYIDDEILGPISLLHDMVLPPNLQIKHPRYQEIGIVDSIKSSIYGDRYQQMIRSALIIAITELTMRISKKQQIDYFP